MGHAPLSLAEKAVRDRYYLAIERFITRFMEALVVLVVLDPRRE